MNASAKKIDPEKSTSINTYGAEIHSSGGLTDQIQDNRPSAIAQLKLKAMLNSSSHAKHLTTFQLAANKSMIQQQSNLNKRSNQAINSPIQLQGDNPLEQIESTESSPSQEIETSGKLVPVYANAWEVAFTEFKPKAEKIGKIVKGEVSIAPLKGMQRAGEKTKEEYDGKSEKLVDVARASIVCSTIQQALDAYSEAGKQFEIVRVKNRFQTPSAGYRDLLLNVKLSNGHVAELQIHLKAIIDAKQEGHKDYEEARTLEAKKEPTPEETARLEELRLKMEVLYDAAWNKAISIPEK
jgi:hypothetical protein